MVFAFLSKYAGFLVPSANGSCSAPCSRRRISRVATAKQEEGQLKIHTSSPTGVIGTVPRPEISSCAGAPSCYTNPIFSKVSLSFTSISLADPPRLAEGVSIDFVDTAYMDGLPEWQMPRKKTNAAGGLMAGLTSLKSISRVWAPYIGIPPRTCQGSTDAPSRQQRINSTASKVCRSLSKQRSRSRSPALVREAVHDRPRCTEDSIAMHSKASKPCHAERLLIMKSTVCKLQDNLKHRMVTTVVSCFSSPLPVREPLYDGPFCTETEFFDLLRMASTPRKAIQRLRPMHWLHPTAVLLASLYESLQTSTYQPRRLMKLLQQHMGMIHLVGPVPAQMGCQKMPPITPYILSEQALLDASKGTLGDVCRPAHLPSDLPSTEPAVSKELVNAARCLYPGLCSSAPADLPPHRPTQRPHEPVQDQQKQPQVLERQAVEQESVPSCGTEAIPEEKRGSARPVINIVGNAAFIRASIAPVGLINTSGGADTPAQEQSPIPCSRPNANKGDEPLIAEIRALTEEDLPIIPQPKQLALACNPAPVAARALPEASTAFRAGPSRPIFVGKSCRRGWASRLTRKLSAYFTPKTA